MKILVTGSTGFVGSHLCDHLVANGHEVYSLARSKKKFAEFKVQGEFIEGSLSADRENNWIKHLPVSLDAVVHTAGIVHSYSKEDFYKTNLRITNRLVSDLSSRYSKLKFVFLSSLAAAGPNNTDHIMTEESAPAPVSHYGRSKLLAEKSLNETAPPQWDVVILRPPMVIGPRDTAVLDIFKMIKGKNVLVTGTKGIQKKYSFICVYDLVGIIIKALEVPVNRKGNIYYTSYNQIISMQKLILEIQRQMGIDKLRYFTVPEKIIWGIAHTLNIINKVYAHGLRLTPDKYNELTPKQWVCSGKKSETEFDYQYDWDLTRTIQCTLKDYNTRGWL